jgi:simple sugar transport system permease protein
VYRQAYGAGGAGLDVPTLPALALPVLSDIPVLGPAFFNQPVATYLALLALPVVGGLSDAGRPGAPPPASRLPWREPPGCGRDWYGRWRRHRRHSPTGRATLVLAQAGTFAERMTAGGYAAIAIVVLAAGILGRRVKSPLFAAMRQYLFQTLG